MSRTDELVQQLLQHDRPRPDYLAQYQAHQLACLTRYVVIMYRFQHENGYEGSAELDADLADAQARGLREQEYVNRVREALTAMLRTIEPVARPTSSALTPEVDPR